MCQCEICFSSAVSRRELTIWLTGYFIYHVLLSFNLSGKLNVNSTCQLHVILIYLQKITVSTQQIQLALRISVSGTATRKARTDPVILLHSKNIFVTSASHALTPSRRPQVRFLDFLFHVSLTDNSLSLLSLPISQHGPIKRSIFLESENH